MIRPPKIVQILQHTKYLTRDRQELTLQQFLCLYGSTQKKSKSIIEKYAEQLYQISAGHPRTIADILMKRCEMISSRNVPPADRPEFVLCDEGFLSAPETKFIEQTALKFSSATALLLKSCKQGKSSLNLRKAIDGVTFEHLLPPLRIGFEELSPTKIRLCVPDRVQLLLEALVSPLFEYIKTIELSNTVPINFSFAFELLVAKIFNHVFHPKSSNDVVSSPKKPKEVNDTFFNTPVFGNWDDFVSDINTRIFPKVTSASSRKDGRGYTVSPTHAKEVVGGSYKRLPPNGLWLLPRPQSSSPDLMHISVSKSGSVRRIVCVAVKNYSAGSYLVTNDIHDEIEKSERMIPDETYDSVLFVACTSYHEDIQREFGEKGFHVFPAKANGKLREVILLNLTTPALRAQICGCSKFRGILGFEILINKTQGELGFDNLAVDNDDYSDSGSSVDE
jgi:hypothetical protein